MYVYLNYYPASLKNLIVYHDYFPTLLSLHCIQKRSKESD